jgi:D-alanine-D-alanine ligase
VNQPVLILHNAVSESDSAADRDVLIQVESVATALAALGHKTERAACTLDLDRVRQELLAARPAMVFNLVESLGGSDGLAQLLTALLDTLGIPYTGAHTEALFLTNHKLLTKERLRQAGLPTPDWATQNGRRLGAPPGEPPLPDAASRYVLKTISEHASFALEDDAVVCPADGPQLRAELAARCQRLRRECFAERYIEGREFNQALLAGPDGPQALPPAETIFSDFPPHLPKLLGYRAKWEEGSFEYEHTRRTFDIAPADQPLLEQLRALAVECWRLFGLSGYARVDFRVDEAGQPWILEINANPCLSPDAGYAAALEQAGIPFATAVERIIADCGG